MRRVSKQASKPASKPASQPASQQTSKPLVVVGCCDDYGCRCWKSMVVGDCNGNVSDADANDVTCIGIGVVGDGNSGR
ncbi:hypothetical protein M0804_014181 [Polistes exclamans]|nr:hypothetical protein M0804_014189 [Polistes exclamans]KAI4475632.1 hypothetical protein M0804_014181 [Polistes exclamans]